MSRITMRLPVLLLAATIACGAPASAQHEGHGSAPRDTTMGEMPGMSGMSDGMATNPHMRMTALRRGSAADSARARALVDTLRAALAKYRDVGVAEAEGFRLFAPQVKEQRVYHFTRNRNALKAAFVFDPAEPTSLLYTKDGAGGYTLVGAMYTAPRRATEDELNARVPLSIARWHEHVAICIPKPGDEARWRETRDGRPLFGPTGAIATKPDCEAAGGRWFAQLFGWMVHANVFASNDPAVIWGDSQDPPGMTHGH
jgi:hypothetical protein